MKIAQQVGSWGGNLFYFLLDMLYGFKGKPRIFFCDLVSLNFFTVSVVSWIFFCRKNWNCAFSQFYAKKAQKKGLFLCQVSLKLGQFFETTDSFSETGLKLSTVSAQIVKMGYYRVKTRNLCWNQCKKVMKFEQKNEKFLQNCWKKMKIWKSCARLS